MRDENGNIKEVGGRDLQVRRQKKQARVTVTAMEVNGLM
jgi:hypothetical protein